MFNQELTQSFSVFLYLIFLTNWGNNFYTTGIFFFHYVINRSLQSLIRIVFYISLHVLKLNFFWRSQLKSSTVAHRLKIKYKFSVIFALEFEIMADFSGIISSVTILDLSVKECTGTFHMVNLPENLYFLEKNSLHKLRFWNIGFSLDFRLDSLY